MVAQGFALSENDVRVLAAYVVEEEGIRVNSFDRNTDTQVMSPETYVSQGGVGPRHTLPTGEIIAGDAILPIYELEVFDSKMEILPVLLADDITQLKLRVFNVRECTTPNDYNYISRDKQGRWQIDWFKCERALVTVPSSSSSSSSSSASSSSAGSLGACPSCNFGQIGIGVGKVGCRSSRTLDLAALFSQNFGGTVGLPDGCCGGIPWEIRADQNGVGGLIPGGTGDTVAAGTLSDDCTMGGGLAQDGIGFDANTVTVTNNTKFEWELTLIFLCKDATAITSVSTSPTFCPSIGGSP